MRYATYILAILMLASAAPLVYAQTEGDSGAGGDNTSPPDPSTSSAYSYKREGIFGCNQTGSYSMSVGSLSATGGAYVPVNDAAVTLNTGYLVYKECVLRGIVNRQREAATAGILKQVVNTIETGRNGNPQYSKDLATERADKYTGAIVSALQNPALNEINPAFSASVKRAVAQGYRQALTAPGNQFKCGYTGNLQAALQGNEFSMELLQHLMNPACNMYWSYQQVNNYVHSVAGAEVEDMMTKLGWGQGYYGVEQCDAYGTNCKTLTPGSTVRSNFNQVIQSGFNQLQQANDIDQMVGALFSGITSQVLGDNRGIAGLMQKTGTQASYIDQVVTEAAQGLRTAAGNAALQILNAAKQVELNFKQAWSAVSQELLSTTRHLRTIENACWNLIIENVCEGSLAADKTCTEKGGTAKLKVATSTAFSQQVINDRVRSIASTTEDNIKKTDNAITLIDRLIAGITNSASLDAQRVALQQLDNLTAQRALHSQYDLQQAIKAKEDVTASMETLRTDKPKEWSESSDVNTGWCNVNNPAVLDFWKSRWK